MINSGNDFCTSMLANFVLIVRNIEKKFLIKKKSDRRNTRIGRTVLRGKEGKTLSQHAIWR